jgi:hypothetical protein
VFHDDPHNDEVSETFGCECHDGGDEETHLCKSIDDDENGIKGRGGRKTDDEVHQDGVPRTLRDGEEFKGAICSMV